jgi:hypothetical protein
MVTLRIKPSIWNGSNALRQYLNLSWGEFLNTTISHLEKDGVIPNQSTPPQTTPLVGWTCGSWSEHDGLIEDAVIESNKLSGRVELLQGTLEELSTSPSVSLDYTIEHDTWDDGRDPLTRNRGILDEVPVMKAIRVSPETWIRFSEVRVLLSLTWSELLDLLCWHLIQDNLLPDEPRLAILNMGVGGEIRQNRLWQKVHGVGSLCSPVFRSKSIDKLELEALHLEEVASTLVNSLEIYLETTCDLELLPTGDLDEVGTTSPNTTEKNLDEEPIIPENA